MHAWIIHLGERLRTSLWVIPAAMTVAAALLAYFTAALEQAVEHWAWAPQLLYSGTPAGTRTLLSTVAGSMITVAGVSFSVTMVALSLASSQLGPRLLVNFMRDRGNQVVLGSFIATFMYCLIALGTAPQDSGYSASASIAILLAVISLMLLIYFIHHMASSMQADVIIQSIAQDIDQSLCVLFPDGHEQDPAPPAPQTPRTDGAEIAYPATGYLQNIDEKSLIEVAEEHDTCLEVLRRPGHYLTPGVPLLRVIGQRSVSDALRRRLLQAFIVGGARTPEQDPEYGIFQLVEVALRALSPGINDPMTAMTCIDHLSGSLASVAAATEKPPVRTDDDGKARLYLNEISFQDIIDAAFNQIRQSAAGKAAPAMRILEALTRIAAVTQDADRHAALQNQADQLYDACKDHLTGTDLRALETRYREFLEQVSSKRQEDSAADGSLN